MEGSIDPKNMFNTSLAHESLNMTNMKEISLKYLTLQNLADSHVNN